MPIPAGPSPELPGWAPALERVAAYVPRRTIVGSVTGYGTAQAVFTDDTYPTGAMVSELILAACNWVLTAAGPITTDFEAPAADLAALRAAGWVALSFPDNRDDLDDARLLLDQADKMLKTLAAANIAAAETPDDPGTTADNVLPYWSFPAATELPI
jgi:hypothetical protein